MIYLLKAAQQSAEVVLDEIQRTPQSGQVDASAASTGRGVSGEQPADTAERMLQPANGMHAQRKGTFESRTEEASADLYFHYYSLIQHQCAHPQLLSHFQWESFAG